MVWGLILLSAVILGARPAFFGLVGLIASAAIWVGFFVAISLSMTRVRMRLFAQWGPIHLAAIVFLPVILVAGAYVAPGVIAI